MTKRLKAATIILGAIGVLVIIVASLVLVYHSPPGSTSATECSVDSIFNGSCGFAVNPPSWARAFPELNHTTYYQPDGMYGYVRVNSTAYTVISPSMVGNVTIPAACIVTLPNFTSVSDQTSTYMIAHLPGGVIANITLPSYSFCPKSHS
jgi:hypothetical protein